MISRKFRPAIIALSALMLAAPATAQLSRSDSYTFLQAVRDSKGQDVLDLLNKPGTTIVNTHDRSTGEGALHIVVKRGDTTYLTFLLQHGADPNIQDKHGVTPLVTAVNENQEACLQILIDAHADVDLANDSGETPLIRAVQMRNVPIIRDLLKAGADPNLTDHIAGLSARDYAHRDTRSPGIARLIDDAPKHHKATAEGPRL